MSLKSRVIAAAAVLTLTGGLSAGVAASPAGAATPSCGNACVNIYPQEYAGQTNNTPQFVLDVYRQGRAVGQPAILYRASNADPAEDWTFAFLGSMADFYAAGLVSSAVALHYGCVVAPTASNQIPCGPNGVNDQVFEIEYSPFGVDSGLCLGVALTAYNGEGVTLQPCGVTSKTVWIEDTFSNDASPSGPGGPYWAGINGSDTNFSNPYVLTYPGNAYPTDYYPSANPHRAQLTVTNLAQFSQGAAPDDSNQLWTAFPGDLP